MYVYTHAFPSRPVLVPDLLVLVRIPGMAFLNLREITPLCH